MICYMFEEKGELAHFFVYIILLTSQVTWAVIRHQPATPMSMYALFGVTILEVMILVDVSEVGFIHLITKEKDDAVA